MSVNQGENLFEENNQSKGNNNSLTSRDNRVFYHQTLSTPVLNTIAKVDGAYIYDTNGKKYLDLHGNGVHTVGYNNPEVAKSIKDLLESGLTFSPRRFTNKPAVELGEKLINISPEGLDRVLFCPGGSQAVEMAIMLAKLNTGKWKTLSYYGTFHGAGFQSISVGADPHFKDGLGPLVPGAIHLELPSYYRNPWGWKDKEKIDDEYVRQLKVQVASHSGIAGFISEPVFYNSTVPTKYYWEQVKEICKEYGILLIFDEIYTAFGRTGKMFASEHFVTPDILVVGKGFGGGIVPFAGLIGRSDLNTVQNHSIGHYTHEKSPLCATVANSVIDFVLEKKLIQHASSLGSYFKQQLIAVQEEFDIIGNVDGLGLNLSLELVEDKQTKERAHQKALQLLRYCLDAGVSFKLIQGNIVNIKPSLVITKDEVDFVISVFREGLTLLK